jgi:uncharacterized protein (DUF302 family)
MLVKFMTVKTVGETATALQAAVQANNYGIMQICNLKETMAQEGVAFVREFLIYEICQPQQVKKVGDKSKVSYTAIPYRISIYDEGGKPIRKTVKATTLLAMLNAPQVEEDEQEVEETIVKIMKAAAAG